MNSSTLPRLDDAPAVPPLPTDADAQNSACTVRVLLPSGQAASVALPTHADFDHVLHSLASAALAIVGPQHQNFHDSGPAPSAALLTPPALRSLWHWLLPDGSLFSPSAWRVYAAAASLHANEDPLPDLPVFAFAPNRLASASQTGDGASSSRPPSNGSVGTFTPMTRSLQLETGSLPRRESDHAAMPIPVTPDRFMHERRGSVPTLPPLVMGSTPPNAGGSQWNGQSGMSPATAAVSAWTQRAPPYVPTAAIQRAPLGLSSSFVGSAPGSAGNGHGGMDAAADVTVGWDRIRIQERAWAVLKLRESALRQHDLDPVLPASLAQLDSISARLQSTRRELAQMEAAQSHWPGGSDAFDDSSALAPETPALMDDCMERIANYTSQRAALIAQATHMSDPMATIPHTRAALKRAPGPTDSTVLAAACETNQAALHSLLALVVQLARICPAVARLTLMLDAVAQNELVPLSHSLDEFRASVRWRRQGLWAAELERRQSWNAVRDKVRASFMLWEDAEEERRLLVEQVVGSPEFPAHLLPAVQPPEYQLMAFLEDSLGGPMLMMMRGPSGPGSPRTALFSAASSEICLPPVAPTMRLRSRSASASMSLGSPDTPLSPTTSSAGGSHIHHGTDVAKSSALTAASSVTRAASVASGEVAASGLTLASVITAVGPQPPPISLTPGAQFHLTQLVGAYDDLVRDLLAAGPSRARDTTTEDDGAGPYDPEGAAWLDAHGPREWRAFASALPVPTVSTAVPPETGTIEALERQLRARVDQARRRVPN
ncbi:hypothetical protein BC828DRAFT_388568 [Blastocladiella britannica]|nr:hypothetical protein BC828DRAFT_388568 [Blastocladiella britannica]